MLPRRPFRLWIALFTLSWAPIFLGLAERARITFNSQFWQDLATIAPNGVGLRVYWFATTPLIAAALIAAAVLLWIRRPYAALFAAGAFLSAILLNVGELAVITFVHRYIATTLATEMQIPPEQVAGLQVGIVLSLASLGYKMLCLLYLHQARQVQDLFGPVTWRRVLLWVESVVDGEDLPDEAAA